MDIKSILNSKHLKAIVLIPVLATASTAANAVLIRYDFMEELHPVFPPGELYSGYYIFESDTPDTNPLINAGGFTNPIREIGINFSGQSEVFNNCLSASCSTMQIIRSAEEHYNFTAGLSDITGTRTLSFNLRSGDLFDPFDLNPNQTDILQSFPNQTYNATPSNVGNLSFNFLGTDGTIYSDSTVTFSITRVGEVPLPAAFWLFGSGIIGLVGIARYRKT